MEANACKTQVRKSRIHQHTAVGGFWSAAWLFTIGFLHLSFWRGVLALILWPYDVGAHFSSVLHEYPSIEKS